MCLFMELETKGEITMSQNELLEIKQKLNSVFTLKMRVLIFPGALLFVLFGAIGLLLIREVLLIFPYDFVQNMAQGAYLIASIGAENVLNICSIGLLINIGFYVFTVFIDVANFIVSIINIVNEYNKEEKSN